MWDLHPNRLEQSSSGSQPLIRSEYKTIESPDPPNACSNTIWEAGTIWKPYCETNLTNVSLNQFIHKGSFSTASNALFFRLARSSVIAINTIPPHTQLPDKITLQLLLERIDSDWLPILSPERTRRCLAQV